MNIYNAIQNGDTIMHQNLKIKNGKQLKHRNIMNNILRIYGSLFFHTDGVVHIPQNVTVAPGHDATFTCDVTLAHSAAAWKLTSVNHSPLSGIYTAVGVNSVPGHAPVVISSEVHPDVYSSTLTVPGTTKSNMTRVQCISLIVGNLESHFNDTPVAFVRVISE